MSFLLDTNVVSEWVRPRPDPGVVSWMTEVDEDQVFLSVATLAELRYGIARLPLSRRRARLDRWLAEELPVRFEGRILPVDDVVAIEWGNLVAARRATGRSIEAMDALIAATARVYEFQLVTRNSRDFEGSVPAMINPWNPE